MMIRLIPFATAAFLAAPALAGVTYTSQTRTVHTLGGALYHDELSAPDFGPWTATLDKFYPWMTPPAPMTHCFATQTSSLNESGILLSGQTLIEMDYPGQHPSAGAHLEATFALSGADLWAITLGATFPGPDGSISLFNMATSERLAVWFGGADTTVSVLPGTYGVRADVGSRLGGGVPYDIYANIAIVPAPAAAGVLASAGLVAARRRRS